MFGAYAVTADYLILSISSHIGQQMQSSNLQLEKKSTARSAQTSNQQPIIHPQASRAPQAPPKNFNAQNSLGSRR